MVHFVGAGCGAPDLITLRGHRLLSEADVVIYAGSLVNPALLGAVKPDCEIHDSAGMTLEEVFAVMRAAEAGGKTTVRLHTGDPATMVVFLSAGLLPALRERLLAGGYREDTPAAIVYKASWPDEKCVAGTVGDLPAMAEENGISRMALILVGEFLGEQYDRSKLYDPAFSHGFREAEQ